MTPAEAASGARAIASAWIAGAPNLIIVLLWHLRLCGTCGPECRCAEYHEILEEYGAGPYGAAVFFPAG